MSLFLNNKFPFVSILLSEFMHVNTADGEGREGISADGYYIKKQFIALLRSVRGACIYRYDCCSWTRVSCFILIYFSHR